MWYLNRRKGTAEARKIEVETEAILLQKYAELLERQERRMNELEHENQQLLTELRKLRASADRQEYILSRISSLLSGVLDDETRETEPYRSILKELANLTPPGE